MKIMTTGSLLSHARMSQTYHLHMPLTYCALYKMSVLQSWQLDTPPSELVTKPESYDIGHSDEIIPVLLYNFLALVLLGEEKCNINVHYDDTHDAMKKVETAASIHRSILCIGQNIVFAAHGDHVPTPKHILLSSAVHHPTRVSSQIVNLLLNLFGHGIFQCAIQETNTVY